MYFAFAFHNDLHASVSCWVQVLLALFPLQKCWASVATLGKRHFLVHKGLGIGLRLTQHRLSSYQSTRLCHASPVLPRFRMNGSHTSGWKSHRKVRTWAPPA